MSKLIYCNFEASEDANRAIESLKKAFPQQMVSFLVDNSARYSRQNIDEYAPQGIPTAVLNQLYGGEAPPQATNSVQSSTSSYGQDEVKNVTTLKLSFTDDTPRDILSKLTELGATNIKSYFS